MDDDEFDDLFPDFTVMWDEIKNEYNRELFDLEDEDLEDLEGGEDDGLDEG